MLSTGQLSNHQPELSNGRPNFQLQSKFNFMRDSALSNPFITDFLLNLVR